MNSQAKNLVEIPKTKNRGEWLSWLRCHTENQSAFSSNLTEHLVGLWDSTSSQDHRSPKDLLVKLELTEIINNGWIRLSPRKWSKIGQESKADCDGFNNIKFTTCKKLKSYFVWSTYKKAEFKTFFPIFIQANQLVILKNLIYRNHFILSIELPVL